MQSDNYFFEYKGTQTIPEDRLIKLERIWETETVHSLENCEFVYAPEPGEETYEYFKH